MGWLRRLRATANSATVDQILTDETRFHFESLVDEYTSRGLARRAAEREARRRLGNLTLVHESARDADTIRWLGDFARDVRFAVRLLRNGPTFSAAVILTFALGIGANAAIFNLLTAVVLQTLPVRQPAQLVLFSDVTSEGTQTGNSPRGAWPLFSFDAYEYLRQQPLPFESIAAVRSGEATVSVALGSDRGVERAQAHLVSGNYFTTMGVDITRGRSLRPDDDTPGAAPVAIVSDGFWRRSLNADPAAIGRPLRLNRQTVTVVGVAPPEFFGERMRRSPDFWIPLVFQADVEMREDYRDRRDAFWLSLIGRLAPGTTRAQAQAAATVALKQFLDGPASPLNADDRAEARDDRIQLVTGQTGISGVRDNYERSLWILLIVVGIVLLLTCANVASLILSRAAARRGEFSMRLALGAGPPRLARQFVAESVLLTAAGAVIGVIAARWTTDALLRSVVGVGSPVRATLDLRLLLVITAITAGASLVFGVMPALFAARRDVASGGKPSRHGWVGRLGIDTLVVGQLALSLVLLVGATLMGQSLLRLQRQPLGFEAADVVLVRAFPRIAGYTPDNATLLYRQLVDRARALPGAGHATVARFSPFSGNSSRSAGAIEGYEPAPGERVNLEEVLVGPDYPETMGIRVLQGRAIEDRDAAGRTRVGMVNEAFVRRYVPSGQAIGRHFGLSGTRESNGPTDIEIVGVLADAYFRDLRVPVQPIVFTAYWQNTTQSALDVEVAVRVTDSGGASANDIKRALIDVDRNLPLADPRRLETQVSGSLDSPRLAARFIGGFGLLAVLLACVGLYGVVSQAVLRRVPELGVRVALGASRAHVLWLFLRRVLGMLAVGLLIGIPLAMALGGVLASQLFGVSMWDPGSFAAAIVALLLIAFLAVTLPVRRATRIDPLTVIRVE